MQKEQIIRYNKGMKQNLIDNVANEHLIKLFLNKKEILSIATFPLNTNQLIIGFLFSEGIISSLDDIENRKFNEKNNDKNFRPVLIPPIGPRDSSLFSVITDT